MLIGLGILSIGFLAEVLTYDFKHRTAVIADNEEYTDRVSLRGIYKIMITLTKYNHEWIN
jgi:hypothetical protein